MHVHLPKRTRPDHARLRRNQLVVDCMGPSYFVELVDCTLFVVISCCVFSPCRVLVLVFGSLRSMSSLMLHLNQWQFGDDSVLEPMLCNSFKVQRGSNEKRKTKHNERKPRKELLCVYSSRDELKNHAK